MHRPTIGLIAIVLLAIGLYTYPQSDSTLSAACLRVGAVMSILWFAHPQIQNAPRWLVAISVVMLFVVMRWPKLLVLAAPVLLALWLLGPRAPRSRHPPLVKTRD
jgi:hypothetical protein